MDATITIQIKQPEVYEEVAKATDYTGAKLIDSDNNARERILAVDEDLWELGRFWDEAVAAANETLKEMLVSGRTKPIPTGSTNKADAILAYEATLAVSLNFDQTLTASVESTLRSFFIASIIAQWFKFANKSEAEEYFVQAGEMMKAAERLLYSRRGPTLPSD